MSDMTIEDYLAQGGKLTSPGNVPARYRGELLRLMASFVDSELAGAAGFADTINDAPGITADIAALNRIRDGQYGTCANCCVEIAPARLKALPTATLCINCAP